MIYVLIVNGIALAATLATAWLVPISSEDLLRFGVLGACAVVAIEMTRQIERKREYVRGSTSGYIDTKAVWSFAAVLVLPPALASAMVILTYFVAWCRIWPSTRPVPLYRWIFSCATVLCGTQAAGIVLAAGSSSYPGVPASLTLASVFDLGIIVFAAALRFSINVGLVMVAIALSNPTARVRDLFTNFGDQLLEAGAMSLGLVAAAVVVSNPIVLVGIVVALVALHRGVLVHQYEQASRIDTKTGLATAGRWHEFAEQTLSRSEDRNAPMGLLIIDLDHFKTVNDTYGHPFGDEVLEAVAKELLSEVRDQDACGRWGGEEFAVALPDVGNVQNLYNVAERIRRRVQSIVLETPGGRTTETLSLSASVGAALYPAEGISTLDELILAADTALYDAKNSGRNTVRLSMTVPSVPPPDLAPAEIDTKPQGSSPAPS
nr:GGDEF domain-containing protein [Phytoactinopolyspora alkaliphila]